MDLSPLMIALLAVAALSGAVTQSAAGLGASTLFAPAAFIALPPTLAVAAVTLYGLIVSCLIACEGRSATLRRLCRLPGRDDTELGRQLPVSRREQRRVLLIALAAAVPIQLAVIYWARALPEELLTLAGAAALAVAALSQLPRIELAPEPRPAHAGAAAVIGALAGATKATVGVNGPIIAPYLFWLGWPRWQMRKILAQFLGAVGVVNLILLAAFHGAADHLDLIVVILALAVPALAGQLIGARSMRVLGREGHRWAVFTVSMAGAVCVALTAL